MKKNATELVFIIDRSGSMQGYEADTVGGINSTLERQRSIEGEVTVSTVLFNTQTEVIHDRISIDKIKPMSVDNYRVGGCTALLDALGGSINHIRKVHKYIRPEDVPEHTVFVITTDGMENSSTRYSGGEVREMIKQQTDEAGWEFIFLAANIDAVDTARYIGIREERAANFTQNSAGYTACYEAAAEFMCAKRSRIIKSGDNSTGWKKKLEKK